MIGVLGEEDRGLARGVAAPDDGDAPAAAQLGLDRRRRVVHAGAFELRQPRHVEPPVARAGGQHDGARAKALAALELDDVVAVLVRERVDALGSDDAHAEARGLHRRALRELGAGDPGGEAEVVLDARRGAGLAAQRDRVDEHGGEAFGRRVDRGSQACRAGTDDDRVAGFLGRSMRT